HTEVQQDDQRAHAEDGQAVPESPEDAHEGGRTHAPMVRRDRGHRHHVVAVRGVAYAENEAEAQERDEVQASAPRPCAWVCPGAAFPEAFRLQSRAELITSSPCFTPLSPIRWSAKWRSTAGFPRKASTSRQSRSSRCTCSVDSTRAWCSWP